MQAEPKYHWSQAFGPVSRKSDAKQTAGWWMLLIWVCSGSWAAAEKTAPPPVAVVANVEGLVTVRRKGKPPAEPVRAATPLYGGDAVWTGEEGTATIYFPNRHPQVLKPKSRFIVPGKSSPGEPEKASLWRTLWQALVGCLKRCLGSPRPDRPAAVRGGNEEEGVPTALAPRETRLLEPPRRFVWSPVPGATQYEIVVGFYETDEKIWRIKTPQTEVAYPPEAPPFQPGQKYYWQVTAWPGEELDSSWFQVLTAEEAEPIRAARAAVGPKTGVRPDRSLDLTWVSLELAQGLLQEAIGRLQVALKENPEDPLRWQLLSQAYRQIGLTGQAKAAADKAGSLPKAEQSSWDRLPAERPSEDTGNGS